MAYTSDEKNAAVLRIVQGNPRFKRSSLATRRVDTTSDEVSELIRTALFYEPDAVYYLAYLSSNYHTRTVKTAQTAVTELLDAIDDLLVPDRPIEDVSSLSEARRALQSMETALSANGIVSSRGFSRYNAAITKSRDGIGNAVKTSGVSLAGGSTTTDIVRPRSQARSDANSGLKTLKSLHASILTAVDLMLRAYDIYTSSGIATSVARTQISRAKSDLEDLEGALEGLTPSERVLQARDALLRIVANKGLVKAIAESPAPGEPKVSGSSYRASAYGTGTAPYVEGGISAPWPLTSTARIVEVDVGGTVASVDISSTPNGLSTAASLLSGNFENFKIGPTEDPYPISTKRIVTGGTFAIAGKTLFFIVDGVLYEVNFVGNRTAAQLAGDINLAIPVVTATAVTSGGLDHVDIDYASGLPPPLSQNRYMRVASGVNNATGLAPWYVEGPSGAVFGEYSKGCDATDELRVQVNDAVSFTTINLTQGSWPDYLRTAAEVAADISGTGFTASDDSGRVRISSTIQGDGSRIKALADSISSETTSHRTLRVLGFNQNDELRGESVDGRVVQNTLNEDVTFKSVATATARRNTLLTARNAVVTGLSQLSIELDADSSSGWTASKLKVTVSNGANHGTYGVSSVVWTAPNLILNLSRQLVDQAATNKHSISVVEELLRLTSKSAGTTAYVDVAAPANSAHAVLGLSTVRAYGTVEQLLVEYNDPVLGWVPADLRRSKIDVGDIVLDDASVVATVTGVASVASGILDVTPIAPSTLITVSNLYVMSGDAKLHEAFVLALETWSGDLSPFNDEELSAIDRVLAPILILQNPSRDQLASAYGVVEAYGTKLSDLKTVLDSYVVPSIAVVDDALRTMEEHGQDRARALLLEGRFDEFFGVTPRTASFSRTMMDAASRLTVNDLNEPTMTRGEEEKIFQRVTAFWEEDTNPSLSVESEEPFPASPFINFWPDEK